MRKKPLWISWERHRRSYELARALDATLYVFESPAPAFVRYSYLSFKTIQAVLRERPAVVFAQNPSIILATLVCMLRRLLAIRVIIDRHSNFKLNTAHSKQWKWRLFHILSHYTVRKADLTIITTATLKNVVDSWGGQGYVLQDKLPQLDLGRNTKLLGKRNIVAVTTYSQDEPIVEIIRAARNIDPTWFVYITGNYGAHQEKEKLFESLPPNVRLTGFLPENEFQSLLVSADVLLVLTTSEDTLTCGAYEGTALSKPMVLSDTQAIREYFVKGVVYSKPDAVSIARAVERAISSRPTLLRDINEFREEVQTEWNRTFSQLIELIHEF